MNKYVSFLDDDDFLSATEKVVSAYSGDEFIRNSYKILEKSKNTLDIVKIHFDIYSLQYSLEDWCDFEAMRQFDKKINNKIGEFHQEILGNVEGWENLGTGDKSRVDLMKSDKTIFIELKNKYNTMNSDSKKECRNKLEQIIEKYPDATAYWAYIIEKNNQFKDEPWVFKNKNGELLFDTKENIRIISGYKVYELVTGNKNALLEVNDALPDAINDILGKDYSLSDEEYYKLEYFKNSFFR